MTDASPELPASDTRALAPDPIQPAGPLANPKLCWALLTLALALRVIRFLHDHALWLDEAFLALNLIDRSFAELTTELDYEQFAPIGFLFVMKSFVAALGRSDYVFRLFPFIGSLISIPVFYALAKRLLKPSGVPVALALFALSHPLLVFAAEAKPYGSDATIALILSLLAVNYAGKSVPRIADAALLAVAGAVAVWFSYPAAFVLAGIGTALGVAYIWQRDWRNAILLGVVPVIWLASFGIQAWMVMGNAHPQLPENDLTGLREVYSQDFLPWPPSPAAVTEWLLYFFPYAAGFFTSEVAAGVGVFACIMGCIALGRDKRRPLAILALPLVFALFVSAAELYPMRQRFLMFIGPALLLVIAAGFDEVRTRVGTQGRIVWVLLLIVILVQPSLRAVKQSIRLERHGDARPAVARLDDRIRDGDTLYLHWTGEPVYRLYSNDPHPEGQIVVGSRSLRWSALSKDVPKIDGKSRVWVLFSYGAYNTPAGQTLRDELDRRGVLIDAFESEGAALYLYDLSREPEAGTRTSNR